MSFAVIYKSQNSSKQNTMVIKTLLVVQTILTLTTFLIIIISPTLIPSSFGISVKANQFALVYLIGANELALAYLSFAGTRITDMNSLKAVIRFFIVFHAATGLVCLYALQQGFADIKILGNVGFRLVASLIFYYYGIFKLSLSSIKINS